MIKVDFSITNKMTFMKELGITPNEYELIIGLCMAQDEEVEDTLPYKTEMEHPSHVPDVSYLIGLQNLIGKVELRKLLLELQNKGIILKSCKLPDPNGEEGMRPNDIKFNKNFLKKYIRHSGEMFWELYWSYPEVADINGKLMSLRNTFGNGGWGNLDEAASFYGQRIQYNAATHKMIIDLVNKAKEQGILNMGLVKFLRGEEWRNIEQLISNGGYGNKNLEVSFV